MVLRLCGTPACSTALPSSSRCTRTSRALFPGCFANQHTPPDQLGLMDPGPSRASDGCQAPRPILQHLFTPYIDDPSRPMRAATRPAVTLLRVGRLCTSLPSVQASNTLSNTRAVYGKTNNNANLHAAGSFVMNGRSARMRQDMRGIKVCLHDVSMDFSAPQFIS